MTKPQAWQVDYDGTPIGEALADAAIAVLSTAGITTPEEHGAVGDGVTDDTAALKLALETGKKVLGTAGATYLCGKIDLDGQLVVHADFGTSALVHITETIDMVSAASQENARWVECIDCQYVKISGGTWDYSGVDFTNYTVVRNNGMIHCQITASYALDDDYYHEMSHIRAFDVASLHIGRFADARTETSGFVYAHNIFGRRCGGMVTSRGNKIVVFDLFDVNDEHASCILGVSDALKPIAMTSELSYGFEGHTQSASVTRIKRKYGQGEIFNQVTGSTIVDDYQLDKFGWYISESDGLEYPILKGASSRKGEFAEYKEYNGQVMFKEDHASVIYNNRTIISNMTARNSYFDASGGICDLKAMQFEDGSVDVTATDFDVDGVIAASSPNPSFGISRSIRVSDGILRTCSATIASVHGIGWGAGAEVSNVRIMQAQEELDGSNVQQDIHLDYITPVISMNNWYDGARFTNVEFVGTSYETPQANTVADNKITEMHGCHWTKGGRFRILSNTPANTDGAYRLKMHNCTGLINATLSANAINPNTAIEMYDCSWSEFPTQMITNNDEPQLIVRNLTRLDATDRRTPLADTGRVSTKFEHVVTSGTTLPDCAEGKIFKVNGPSITQCAGLSVPHTQFVVELVTGQLTNGANLITISGSNITTAGHYGFLVLPDGKIKQVW